MGWNQGSDPASGAYVPFEDVLLDDTVTLHTGDGPWDWNEAEYKVAAMTIKLRPGGDWDAWFDLGSTYASSAERGVQAATACSCRALPPCDPARTVQTSERWKMATTGSPAAGWHDPGFDDSAYANAVNASQGSWYDDGSTRWIWEDAAATAGSNEERSFRTEFLLSEIPPFARLIAAADNGCEVYVNGTLIGTVGGSERGAHDDSPFNYSSALTFVVDPAVLVVGINCISIIGWNETDAAPGPAGVYAALTLGLAGVGDRAARCGHGHLLESLATAETDSALLLAPDGVGGLEWRAETAHALDDLTDVDTASTPPTDGQSLVWDDGAGEWIPGDVTVAAAAGESAKASATADLSATTGTAADVTGATLSLGVGTWIVVGNFDVSIKSNADRLFEGILDVAGSDENDLAVLQGVGLDTDDRQQVAQVWRLVLGSTSTVKLQARHSGGSAGDFAVNAANTTLTAYRAGAPVAAPGTFTPTLTASTTNPTLGSGNIAQGRYVMLGPNLMWLSIFLRFGTSGTNAGSGTYTVGNLPKTIRTSGMAQQVAAAHIQDATTTNFHGVYRMAAGATGGTMSMADATNPRDVTHASPMAWTINDFISITGIVEVD